MNGGTPAIALQVAQNILNRTPDDVPALLIRGDALTQMGQNEDAVIAFKAALQRDPASAHGKLGLGRVRLTTNPAEAAGLFRDVLRVDPNNVSALTDLGIALDLLGQHADARTYYRRVLVDNPTNVAVRVNLALSLAMTGDSADAIRLIEPLANDRTAPSKLRHNYAAILTMAGQEARAAEVLKQDMSAAEAQQAMAGYRQGTALASVQPALAPSQPEPPPAIVAAAPVPETPAPMRHSSLVQLGAFNSEQAAKSEWRRLQAKLPSLLAGREPAITTTERNGAIFWRLRTAGFSDRSTASGFCSQVRPANAKCMVLRA